MLSSIRGNIHCREPVGTHLQSRLLASTASNDPSFSTSSEQASPCEKLALEGTVSSGKTASLRKTADPCSRYSYSVLEGLRVRSRT